MWKCALLFLMLAAPVLAQPRVAPGNLYERLLCVAPMVGAGTAADPRRPLFAPTPAERAALRPGEGIVAFRYELSDDGRWALVELVARDRRALRPVLDSRRTDVKVFRRGVASRAEIEREFRQFKRNFDLDRFLEAGL